MYVNVIVQLELTNTMSVCKMYPGNKISPSFPVLVTCCQEFLRNFSRKSSCEWFLGNSISLEFFPILYRFFGVHSFEKFLKIVGGTENKILLK